MRTLPLSPSTHIYCSEAATLRSVAVIRTYLLLNLDEVTRNSILVVVMIVLLNYIIINTYI